jgi:hypothetical protein
MTDAALMESVVDGERTARVVSDLMETILSSGQDEPKTGVPPAQKLPLR